MTREEAKAFDNDECSYDGVQHFAVQERIDQIFNDHEAQLKAKDEEIYWSKVLTLKELCKEVEIDDLLKALSYEQIQDIVKYYKMLKDKA